MKEFIEKKLKSTTDPKEIESLSRAYQNILDAEVNEIKVSEDIDMAIKKAEMEAEKAAAEAEARLAELQLEGRKLDIEEQKVAESKKSRVWGFIGTVLGVLGTLGGAVAVAEIKNQGDAQHRADVERIEKSENIVLNLKKYKR